MLALLAGAPVVAQLPSNLEDAPVPTGLEAVPTRAPIPTYDPNFCQDKRTVIARVVALDQAIPITRFGATMPGGAIFALAKDVVASTNLQPSCYPDPASLCQPGEVQLRDGKRPRPLVLRVNEGECLQIHFTNLLAASNPGTSQPNNQVDTRSVSLHVEGLNWVNAAPDPSDPSVQGRDDGSWVGENCDSQVLPGGTAAPNQCTFLPGSSATYLLYAENEGSYMLYNSSDDFTAINSSSNVLAGGGDGGWLQFGLWGTVNVEPSYEGDSEYFKRTESRGVSAEALWRSEWYRSQVTEQDLCYASKDCKTASGTQHCAVPCARTDPDSLPEIDYQAVYPPGHDRAGLPILNMVCDEKTAGVVCDANEIVHSDLTAVITGPRDPCTRKDETTGECIHVPYRFPEDPLKEQPPSLRPAYSYPQRLQPYREFTISYHETYQVQQAFSTVTQQNMGTNYFSTLTALHAAQDNFGINYGMGGLAPPVLANRLEVGPSADCVECKYEEFFLTSWALGDPAMVVDNPAENCVGQNGQPIEGCQATTVHFPDDPSNVYHSYVYDHLKFRIQHAGPDLHHLHHQHAHQWLGTPNSPNGDYLDSQSIGPGANFTLEMVYDGSGNLNQTAGDSIFHCHFYPHFASGMWSLWRVHDVFEAGTELDEHGRPVNVCVSDSDPSETHPSDIQPNPSPGHKPCPDGTSLVTTARALPDGDIVAGAPTPALVPMPSIPMAPVPGDVRLADDGKIVEVELDGHWVKAQASSDETWQTIREDLDNYINPGFPFWIPGVGGRRAPHPPLDFAMSYRGCSDETLNGYVCTPENQVPEDHSGCICDQPLDGGLPRHVMDGAGEAEYLLKHDPALQNAQLLPYAQTDYSKEILNADALQLDEEGTLVEKVAMAAHSVRFHDTQLPDGRTTGVCSDNKAPCTDKPLGTAQCGNPRTATCDMSGQINFILNGLAPVRGAPYADPCINFLRTGGAAPGGIDRDYLAVDIQLDAIFNKEGWHFPQQRIISLWGDAQKFIDKEKPPEPLFMRVNSYDCMNYTLANLVPNVYELDDFQVRTPTDILGQHIHLVKFDVTSSDGAANGWNYEDGTFAPNEVTERIHAINAAGGLDDPAGTCNATSKTCDNYPALSCSQDSDCQTFEPEATFINFFGPGPGATAATGNGANTGAWLGSQATIQRWYNDPLYNNLGVCETDTNQRCTLGQNTAIYGAYGELVDGCPNDGLCIAAAGFCANDPAQRCTEFDRLTSCGGDFECFPFNDRTIRTVFTHDHFGPSTHQQAGLYAGVLAEPKGSQWLFNQNMTDAECEQVGGTPMPHGSGNCAFGGVFPGTINPIPGRVIAGAGGYKVRDSGPTSWQAMITTPNPDGVCQDGQCLNAPGKTCQQDGDCSGSYREFNLMPQDSGLFYQPFYSPTFYPDRMNEAEEKVFAGQYYNVDIGVCKTATDEPCGFCSYTGRCNVAPFDKCLLDPTGASNCPSGSACLIGQGKWTACTTTDKTQCASHGTSLEGVEACDFIGNIPFPVAQNFGGPPIDASNGTPEGVTFNSATNNFSFNYRNEPLFPRIDGADGQPVAGAAGDLSYVYSSIPPSGTRPNPRGLRTTDVVRPFTPCDTPSATCKPAGLCSDNFALCVEGNTTNCASPGPTGSATCMTGVDAAPYQPLTQGIEAGDPFTPLLRTYTGDDIQIRALMGAHINPHNLTVHGLNWLKEPSFVDSGWRNSEVMGISEHFELLAKVDAPFNPPPHAEAATQQWIDYLYQPGMAAIELASGNWGLLRAYSAQPEQASEQLPVLPQNPLAQAFEPINVCPGAANRKYGVVALTAKQALQNHSGGELVYNKTLKIKDPNAILYFRTDDPNLQQAGGGSCEADPKTCAEYVADPQPLVLRAAAGDCIQVTLYNNQEPGTGPAGNSSLQLTGPQVSAATYTSTVSTEVGLRPQLVTYDLRYSDGTNAGYNPPVQTAAPGGNVTYTWYAGHVEPNPPAGKDQHIPVEFGGSNLLPSDPINHYLHGLFGGLVIEPEGAHWTPAHGQSFAGTEAIVYYTETFQKWNYDEKRYDEVNRDRVFREHVFFTQDDLSTLTAPGVTGSTGPTPVNALNYRSPYLGSGPASQRDCLDTCQATNNEVACVLAQCSQPGTAATPAPLFQACAGEEVRFRLLHPGGTNTNEVFELYGHSFSEAPYMTREANCEPPTTHTNLYASQVLGQRNLCGSKEFWLGRQEYEKNLFSKATEVALDAPDEVAREARQALDSKALEGVKDKVKKFYDLTSGGLWDASLNEWKASKTGHGPGNHFDVLIESAGGPNVVPGDYLVRSFPAMHFNRGIWGIFRVAPKDLGSDGCYYSPSSQHA
ncbi:MAG: hypothetical protein AAF657_20610, partial [Acidobacteriota bacterium]